MCAGASKSHEVADAWTECSAGGMPTTDHKRSTHSSALRPPPPPGWQDMVSIDDPDHLTLRRRLGGWCDVTPPPPGYIILRWPHTHTHTHIGQWWSVRAWGDRADALLRGKVARLGGVNVHRRRSLLSATDEDTDTNRQTDRQTDGQRRRESAVDDTDWATTHRH